MAKLYYESDADPSLIQGRKVAVIGGGPAGIITARTAANLGAKVALVDRDLLGGVCLNTGCIPSKAIIRTARLYAEMRDAENFGAQVPARIDVETRDHPDRDRMSAARLGPR